MAKGTATSGRIKWRFCTLGLVRVGHPVVVYRRGQTTGQIIAMAVNSRSSRRSYCVRQGGTAYAGRVGLLTPAGWDCLRRAWQAGIPGDLRRSLQVLVVVMDASPGFFRRGDSLLILWPVLFILWPGFFILKGLTVQDHRGSVLVHLSHLELFHG